MGYSLIRVALFVLRRSVSQQMFHCLVNLRVFKRIQVDLSYLFGTMAERLADDGGGYSRPFENGCIGVSSNIGR